MIRIGILSPADIAYRRFMPALLKSAQLQYVGVAIYTLDEKYGRKFVQTKEAAETLEKKIRNKGENFIHKYGGSLFESYMEMLTSDLIDAVYIPLPPAVHYRWAKIALENGKHVLLEKPFTVSLENTKELLKIARNKNLAVYENYMFLYHSQMKEICEMMSDNNIGKIYLIRLAFGFPRREMGDFRYQKNMGGGALLDAGGYTIKCASFLLGETIELLYAQSGYEDISDVDIFGSAAFMNHDGLVVQTAFGMDNSYKCELEAWGSNGCVYTGRIFTAPSGFKPEVVLTVNGENKTIKLKEDDSFYHSIQEFFQCIINKNKSYEQQKQILNQAQLVDHFMKTRLTNKKAGRKND